MAKSKQSQPPSAESAPKNKRRESASDDILNKPFLREEVKQELDSLTNDTPEQGAYNISVDLETWPPPKELPLADDSDELINPEAASTARAAKRPLIDWRVNRDSKSRARRRVIFIGLSAVLLIVMLVYVQLRAPRPEPLIVHQGNLSAAAEIANLKAEIESLRRRREELLRQQRQLEQQLEDLQRRINQRAAE